VSITCIAFSFNLLQLQVAYSKGQLKGKIAVETEGKKNFINNVVSTCNHVVWCDHCCYGKYTDNSGTFTAVL